MVELDKPEAVREGEALAEKQLEAYLKATLGLTGDLRVQQFPSGFSNLTYLLELGGRELVLRRPPFGANIKSGHDMSREYRVLSKLHPVYALAPKPLLFCEDERVIGAPFYVMERLQGVILRSGLRPVVPDVMRGVAGALIKALTELHAVDYSAAGLDDLGKPEGYAERQVKGWTRRYLKAQTDTVTSLDAVAAWLTDNVPAQSGASLIHNDFKYDNVILNPNNLTEITAVLDWEMTTLGDPLLDLGTSLGYWTQLDDPEPMRRLGLSPTTWPGNPTRAEVIDLYQAASGRSVDRPVFYYSYGLFKVAVIVQQIYARYRAGLTQDERFAGLGQAVVACADMAAHTIEKGRI